MTYGIPIPGAVSLPDSAVTLGKDEANRRLVITPTSPAIITLPSAGIVAGDVIELHNLAASVKITPEASGGQDIASFQNGSMRVLALQASPTASSHWRILDVVGGASPFFAAYVTSQNVTSSGAVVVEFENTAEDNNDDFNISTYRFSTYCAGSI